MRRLLWWLADSDLEDEYEYDYDECDEMPSNNNNNVHGMNPNKNIMPHDQFLQRIRKTLYVGGHVSAAAPAVSAPSANSQKISRPLAEYAAEYFSEAHRGHSLHRLNSVTVSKMGATPCSLILAMIYLDRLKQADPLFVRSITPTELFVVSMLVSSKFYYGYDEAIDMAAFTRAGDLDLPHLKALEIDLLDSLDWTVFVSNADFFAKLCTVERQLAQRQGCSRGWMTYTEMAQLFPSAAIAHAFLRYSTVFAVSYAASVFTIAGAFLFASQVPGSALYRPGSSALVDSAASIPAANGGPMGAEEAAIDGLDAAIALESAAEAETEQDRGIERLAENFAEEDARDARNRTTETESNRSWLQQLPPLQSALDAVLELHTMLSQLPQWNSSQLKWADPLATTNRTRFPAIDSYRLYPMVTETAAEADSLLIGAHLRAASPDPYGRKCEGDNAQMLLRWMKLI